MSPPWRALKLRQLISFSTDNPNEDPNAAGDPYKTLFISRLVCILLSNKSLRII